jgi:hypothetical protein
VEALLLRGLSLPGHAQDAEFAQAQCDVLVRQKELGPEAVQLAADVGLERQEASGQTLQTATLPEQGCGVHVFEEEGASTATASSSSSAAFIASNSAALSSTSQQCERELPGRDGHVQAKSSAVFTLSVPGTVTVATAGHVLVIAGTARAGDTQLLRCLLPMNSRENRHSPVAAHRQVSLGCNCHCSFL